MSEYNSVLDVVAENPGLDGEVFKENIAEKGLDPGSAMDLLNQAIQSGDVVEANGRYWIVRKGRFAFSEYDHEPK